MAMTRSGVSRTFGVICVRVGMRSRLVLTRYERSPYGWADGRYPMVPIMGIGVQHAVPHNRA